MNPYVGRLQCAIFDNLHLPERNQSPTVFQISLSQTGEPEMHDNPIQLTVVHLQWYHYPQVDHAKPQTQASFASIMALLFEIRLNTSFSSNKCLTSPFLILKPKFESVDFIRGRLRISASKFLFNDMLLVRF